MPLNAELYPWISAAAIAWGLLDCFFGYKIFKLTIGLLGACAGAVGGQFAGTALGFGLPGVIGGIVVGALLGAGLAYLLYLAAVFLAGFALGATLGIMLLASYHHMVALLTGCILGVIGGVAAVKLQETVLILATAVLGAFRALVAVLFFTSRLDWVFYFRQPQQIPALISGHAWLLPAVLLLAGLGAVAQFGLGRGGGGGKAKRPKQSAKNGKD